MVLQGRLETRVAEELARLSGLDFQAEVSALLARNIESFQRMPETREGGLDGLSHNQTVAYCCLGLKESTVRRLTQQKLSDRICKKFQEDMRKLFELKQDRSSGELTNAPNTLLGRIRTSQEKIRSIRLIVNSFDDPRIAGRLQKARDRYVAASENRHICLDCSAVVEGPRELVERIGVGPIDLHHMEARTISALFSRDYSGKGLERHVDRLELDEKMDTLAAANPGRRHNVEALRETY